MDRNLFSKSHCGTEWYKIIIFKRLYAISVCDIDGHDRYDAPLLNLVGTNEVSEN